MVEFRKLRVRNTDEELLLRKLRPLRHQKRPAPDYAAASANLFTDELLQLLVIEWVPALTPQNEVFSSGVEAYSIPFALGSRSDMSFYNATRKFSHDEK
jgi:hypothetical protein